MKVEYLESPCRAFVFMSSEHIPTDPRDGKEKYVLGATSAANHKGHIVLIDPDTLEAEDITIPEGTGLWALLYLPEYERLLVGTCGYCGWLHALDLKTRTWMQSLCLEGELYIWNLVRGGDGKVYGSNYPNCIVYCYDPENHTLTSAGRAGSNPKNMYSRLVHALPDGNILVSVGLTEKETHLFDVKTRQFRQVFEPGEYADEVADGVIITQRNGQKFAYDAETFELLEGPGIGKHPKVIQRLRNRLDDKYAHLLPYRQECYMKELKDGRVIGCFKQQQVFIIKDGELTFCDLELTPPPMMIHGMNVAEDGVVWFGSGFGQTSGYYNPKTGEYWNSLATTRVNGEIYGVVPYNGLIYYTAYAGGDHIVYDPKKPWDQYNNVNPKTLQSVGPHGNIWTGWGPVYGIYGGGLSRIDVNTNEVTGWFGVVPEQSIRHIAAGKKHLFATSHWMNSGMPYRFDDEFHLIRLDTDCNVNWDKKFQLGQFPECLVVLGGRVYMSMRDRLDDAAKILVYDEETMELVTEKVMNPLGGPGKYECEKKSIRKMLPYGEDKLVVFIDDEAHLLDGETLEILQTAQLPDMTEVATIAADNTVYFAVDEKLYRILFD